MKLAHLFIFICIANVVISQTNPSKNESRKDPLAIEDVADTDPLYIGGFDSLSKYLNDSLRWDEVEKWLRVKKKLKTNKVIVRFVVEKNGTISHVAVESASIKCPPCNKEAIRVIQAMPAWTPGYKNDRPVRTWVRIPIIFDMETEN